MAFQQLLEIRTAGRGFTDITSQVAALVQSAGSITGLAQVFARHTSCSVLITENADPAVRTDLETLAARWAPDGDPAYRHDTEGDDDMAAHARSLLAGVAVTVPVSAGRLALGTWQGIYLWEQRAAPQAREVVVTVLG